MTTITMATTLHPYNCGCPQERLVAGLCFCPCCTADAADVDDLCETLDALEAQGLAVAPSPGGWLVKRGTEYLGRVCDLGRLAIQLVH